MSYGMFRLVGLAALANLAGCLSVNTVTQVTAGSHYASGAQLAQRTKCGGTNGVLIQPCPAVLERKSGVEVTVSGPGVVNSDIQTCDVRICGIKTIDPTHWQVFPLELCGIDEIKAAGYNASEQKIGNGFLQVKNRHCHRH